MYTTDCNLKSSRFSRLILQPVFLRRTMNISQLTQLGPLQILWRTLRLYFCRRPFYHDHIQIIEATKSQEANMQLQASWARRGWLQTTAAILSLLSSDEVLHRLELDRRDSSQEHAELFYRLVTQAASKRTWSMSIYDIPPRNFASLLHRQPTHVLHGRDQIRSDASVVQKASQKSAERACDDWEARLVKNMDVLLTRFTYQSGSFCATYYMLVGHYDSRCVLTH